MKRLIRLTLVALWLATATGALVASTPATANAQDVDSRLRSMLEQASEDYDVLMIDEATDRLDKAIDLADRNSESGPIVAQLHIMKGIVEFADSRDESAVERHFVRGIEHDYEATLPAHYRNPDLAKIFERARSQVPEPSDDPSAGQRSGEFEHEPVQTARARQPLELEVFVPADMPVFRVVAHHRRFGENDYERVEMEPTSATRFAVEIPAKQVRTSQIEYYIEALDRAGEVLDSAGSKSSPIDTTVLGSSDEDPDSDPVETPPDEVDDDPIVDDGSSPDQRVYVMLGGGSAVGFLPGGTPTAHPSRPVSSGLAPAFAHGMLDAGYMITEQAHLGLYFRWQFSPPQDFNQVPPESKEGGSFFNSKQECLGLGLPGDCLLGLKYRWFFNKADAPLRVYSSTGAGFGRVRHWLKLKENYFDPQGQVTDQCEGRDRVEESGAGDFCYIRDTVRPGWAHFGVGAGALWPVHDNVDLMADGYLIVLVPETGINFDLNLGVNLRF
jgi:hypothetical protein